MGLFEHFPYTNFHELNAHWILEKTKELLGRMDQAEDDIDSLEGRCDSLEERMTTAEGDIDALEGRCDSLEDRMTTAEGDIDALEGRCDSLEDRMTTAEGDIDALEDRCTALESRCTALENRVEVVYLELGYTDDSEILAPLVRDMIQGKKQLVFYEESGDPFGTTGNGTRHFFPVQSVFQYNAEGMQTSFLLSITDFDASTSPATAKVYGITADADGITWPTIS